MDIESTSLAAMLLVNTLILSAAFVYYVFFYRWDNKTYDDLAENVGGRYNKNGAAIEVGDGELFLGEGASNIESLLGKDESSMQYLQSGP